MNLEWPVMVKTIKALIGAFLRLLRGGRHEPPRDPYAGVRAPVSRTPPRGAVAVAESEDED